MTVHLVGDHAGAGEIAVRVSIALLRDSAVFHVVDRVEHIQGAAVVRDHDHGRPVIVGHLGE